MIRTINLNNLDTATVKWVAETLEMSLLDPTYLKSYGFARPKIEAVLTKLWHHVANEEEEGTIAWGTGIVAFDPTDWGCTALLLKSYCDATSEGHKYFVEWLLGVHHWDGFETEEEYWGNSPEIGRLCEGRIDKFQCDLGYGHTGKHGAVVDFGEETEKMIWWERVHSHRVH